LKTSDNNDQPVAMTKSITLRWMQPEAHRDMQLRQRA